MTTTAHLRIDPDLLSETRTTTGALGNPDVLRARRLRARLVTLLRASLSEVTQPTIGTVKPRGRIENGVLTIPVEVLIQYLATDMAARGTNATTLDRQREHFLD